MYIPRYVFHFVRTRDDCVWILFLEDTLVYECRACVGALGAIECLGSVLEKTSLLDYEPEEQKRASSHQVSKLEWFQNLRFGEPVMMIDFDFSELSGTNVTQTGCALDNPARRVIAYVVRDSRYPAHRGAVLIFFSSCFPSIKIQGILKWYFFLQQLPQPVVPKGTAPGSIPRESDSCPSYTEG